MLRPSHRLVVACLIALFAHLPFAVPLAATPQQNALDEVGSLLGGARRLTFADAPNHVEFEDWTLRGPVSGQTMVLRVTSRATTVGSNGWTQVRDYLVPFDQLATDIQLVRDGLYTRLEVRCADGSQCIQSVFQQNSASWQGVDMGHPQSTLAFGLLDGLMADRARNALLEAIQTAVARSR